MAYPNGAPVHGEFSSADASALTETNSRFAMYGAISTAAVTLGPSDIVQVSHVSFSSAGTNLTCTIYDGSDNTVGAGEVLWRGIVATNTTLEFHFPVPHYCQKGTYPKVKTSGAGQVEVQFHGTIYRDAA